VVHFYVFCKVNISSVVQLLLFYIRCVVHSVWCDYTLLQAKREKEFYRMLHPEVHLINCTYEY
jgi:hypothetical protein